jgi:5-methylcytosine-specific restriction endonuclease McrA
MVNEVLYMRPSEIEAWLAAKAAIGEGLSQDFVRWLVLDMLFDRQKGRCAMCLAQLGKISDFDLDHKQPKFAGGTYKVANLQLLCVPCHRKKTRIERTK